MGRLNKSEKMHEVFKINKQVGKYVSECVKDCRGKADIINRIIPKTVFSIKEVTEETTEKMLLIYDLWQYSADRTELIALAAKALK